MHPARARPFSLEGLPRLPPSAARATRRLARSGLPALAVTLKRIGSVEVRAVRVAFVIPPNDQTSGLVSFALRIEGQPARLGLEPFLGLRLVSAVLGLPSPIALRPLGRSERGVLAAVLVSLLEAAGAGASVRVSLDDAGPLDVGEPVVLDLHVQLEGWAGSARLDLPAALLPTGKRPAIDPLRRHPTVAVELCRTTLGGADFAGAERGDTVVFEAPPLPGAAPWPVRVRLGACSFPAQLHPDGTLRRHGPLEDHESETLMSSEDTTVPVRPASLSDDAARALAAAPVEIVAELARLTVRGDELAGLVDGGVLALGARRPVEVVLRVAGRVWAHGELVALDDELGVRITGVMK